MSKQRVKLTGGLMEKEIIEQFQVARLSGRSDSGILKYWGKYHPTRSAKGRGVRGEIYQ